MEEQNRNKINKKNGSNTNLKLKYDIKEGYQSLKTSKKYSNIKGKNNSMGKYLKKDLHTNLIERNKKRTRNLSNNSFNDNSNNDIYKKKFNKTISQISKNKIFNNNSLNESKKKFKLNHKNKTLNENNNQETIKMPEIKNLAPKEKACLILAYSKCLRLTERVLFSLYSPKLKELIPKKQILEMNKIYLKDKLDELEKRIEKCDNKLKNKFSASKTAEITLNFITVSIETEFKLNAFEGIDDETDKKYCDNYVKLLYLILGENYENIENEMLIKNLYKKIEEENYQNIKDYLFYLYIQNKEENKSLVNIDKINEIIKASPDILNFKITTKLDKFIVYTSVILNEIIKFANERTDTIKLKNDCKKFIDIINMKLNLYKKKPKTN